MKINYKAVIKTYVEGKQCNACRRREAKLAVGSRNPLERHWKPVCALCATTYKKIGYVVIDRDGQL